MSFSPVKNVRINSLTEGAEVQLRFGKAAVRNNADDTITEAVLVAHRKEGKESFVDFEETDKDGNKSITTISRFPGAPWRAGKQYVSLVGVNESTYTVAKPATPIATNIIDEATKLIDSEREDVFAWAQLIALLSEIKDAKRVPTNIKKLATQLANQLVVELTAPVEQAA